MTLRSLWILKLCLLTFYTRFVGPLSWGRVVIRTLWWIILATFVAVVIATLTECRPLSLAWQLAPKDERMFASLLWFPLCTGH